MVRVWEGLAAGDPSGAVGRGLALHTRRLLVQVESSIRYGTSCVSNMEVALELVSLSLHCLESTAHCAFWISVSTAYELVHNLAGVHY